MIHLDVTKTRSARHRSGLTRVTRRLLEELGPEATPVAAPNRRLSLAEEDWYLTAELFSEEERPGITAFLASRRFRAAAIFHDAIPLKHPHITWPQSVARQPGYMKALAQFDRVWAVSAASRDDLVGFWRWQGIGHMPPVDVLALGADFVPDPRRQPEEKPPTRPRLLCLGIIEPRKNQGFLLDACEELWREGLDFELHVVGRINPHFGRPIAARMKSLSRRNPRCFFHGPMDDPGVTHLYATATASVFPTIAEGCGLPLLESLWMGVPCLASDLPALRENAAGGGAVLLPPDNQAAWMSALRRVIIDPAWHDSLKTEARSRVLPTWHAAAQAIQRGLG